jgi:hypothetical protein
MRTTMSFRRGLAVAMAATVGWAVTAAPASAAPEDLTLASTADDGTKGTAGSYEPSLSADGTRVAFYSHASNLVAGDTNDTADVFVKDLVTGEVVLASATAGGTQGDGFSAYPSLSADGTRVAFSSTSTNLADGVTDVHSDIYVKDLVSGELFLASATADGTKANHGSNRPSLSGDGNRVAFWSYAANFVAGDTLTPLTADVFVKDLVTWVNCCWPPPTPRASRATTPVPRPACRPTAPGSRSTAMPRTSPRTTPTALRTCSSRTCSPGR